MEAVLDLYCRDFSPNEAFVCLDEASRERISKKIKRGNSVVLWLYASGVCNPEAEKRFCADNIANLTGIDMRQDDIAKFIKSATQQRNQSPRSRCGSLDIFFSFF
jgi:hypothetical protein